MTYLWSTKCGRIEVVFNNIVMKPSISELHLGIPLGPDAGRVRVETSINDLYRRTNVLMAQFHHAMAEIKYCII
jgi:hypothetical protein